MRPRKHHMTALLYASVFAGATGSALYFFARASGIASLLAAGIVFAAFLIALLAREQ
jgi:ABC-type uncharacterized transport system permease subunit